MSVEDERRGRVGDGLLTKEERTLWTGAPPPTRTTRAPVSPLRLFGSAHIDASLSLSLPASCSYLSPAATIASPLHHPPPLLPSRTSLSLCIALSGWFYRHLFGMELEGQFGQQGQNPRYDCLVFDLDDTLYPLSSGIATQCRKNIEDYMVERLEIEESKVPELCLELYKKYGTTMAGLRAIGYEFDYDDFHSFVHGRLPYDDKLKPDPVLRNVLLSLSIRKVIFTNADRAHAARVLGRLGLEDCFEGIICFETLNPPAISSFSDKPMTDVSDILKHLSQPDAGTELPKTPILCKPSQEAMEHALQMANINPQRTIFFDDSIRNILSGKRIGLHTVLVGTSQRSKGADHALESIHNMREALPELWEDAEKVKEARYSGEVGIETSVIA